MKITAKKQVNSIITNQSVDLEYSQTRENLVKKRENSPSQFTERRKGDRRKSVKSQKNISFGGKNLVRNLGGNPEKKWLKDPKIIPNAMTKAYQKTTETHADWRFPARLTLKEV
ncbi:MAG: hypothetical protein DHS20C07_30980 [Methyloligella sp.]|nr:MAG: hypothetical protein DHS20C07_30980 [Methyloligella sp.]